MLGTALTVLSFIFKIIFSLGNNRKKNVEEFKKYMKARSSEQTSSIDSLNQAQDQMDEFKRLDNESQNPTPGAKEKDTSPGS